MSTQTWQEMIKGAVKKRADHLPQFKGMLLCTVAVAAVGGVIVGSLVWEAAIFQSCHKANSALWCLLTRVL